jgi:FkbM family methyltransferase
MQAAIVNFKFLLKRSLQLDFKFLKTRINISLPRKIQFITLKYLLLLRQLLTPFRLGTRHINWKGRRIYPNSRIGGVAGYQAVLSEHLSLISKLDAPNDGSIILDVGANVGYFSLAIIESFPNVQVFAFEPSKNSANVFRKNIPEFHVEINLEKRISSKSINVLYQLALADKSGIAYLSEDPCNPALSRIIEAKDTSGKSGDLYRINCVTGSSFLEQLNYDFTIHLLKVDVEGNELSVLRGFGDYISSTKYLHIEFNSNHWSIHELFQILNEYGLSFRILNLRSFNLDPNSIFETGDLLLEIEKK